MAVGDHHEVDGKVAARDVAQERAQMTAQLDGEVAHLLLVDHGALHERDLDGLGHVRAVAEVCPLIGARTQGGEAITEEL